MKFGDLYQFSLSLKFNRFLTVFTVTGFFVSLAYAYDEKDLTKQAQQIEAKLNRSVPACDNFYEFACGNYQPEIPRHKASIVELEIIKDTLQEQLNEVFKAPQAENDSNPIRNVKTYYSNCMDTGDKLTEQRRYFTSCFFFFFHTQSE